MITIIYGRYLNLRRNWLPYAFIILLPIVLMIVFGTLINDEESGIRLPVTDLDGTPLSRALIEELDSLGVYNISILDMEHLERMVAENEAEAGFIIPGGFGKSVTRGEIPQLELFVTRGDQAGYSLQGVLTFTIQRIAYNAVIEKETIKFLYEQGDFVKGYEQDYGKRVRTLIAENWEERLPIKVTGSGTEHNRDDMFAHTSIGFTVAFSMFIIVFAVGDILEEKRTGVWGRLSVSPVSYFKILTGGLICSFIMGMIGMMSMAFIGGLIVGVDWFGHIGGVIVIFLAFCFCTVSLGMLLSSIVKTPQQLQVAAPILLVSAAMLGGCYWPLEIVSSRALQAAAKIVPTGWAMQALKDIIIQGQGFERVYLPAAVMLLMGTVFLGIAVQLAEISAN